MVTKNSRHMDKGSSRLGLENQAYTPRFSDKSLFSDMAVGGLTKSHFGCPREGQDRLKGPKDEQKMKK